VDRAARRVAAEEEEKKKDAEKARARERTRARDALEKLRRRLEREGLPREPSPETPDNDDDEDDDEDNDMAARLGLSPGLRLGQESSSQPSSGLAPSVPGVGTLRSRPDERGQTEGVLDPSAGEVEVTPRSQAEASVSREPSATPTAQEGDPQVVVAAPGQSVSRASKVPKARVMPKLAARQTSTVSSGVEIQETSPQARLIMARSG
jgi:DNA-binding protein